MFVLVFHESILNKFELSENLVGKLSINGLFLILSPNNNIRVFGGTIEGSLRIQQASSGRRLQPVEANDNNNNNGTVGNVEDEIQTMATLSSNPKTLREVWREYKFGIDGRKPAEQFTSQARNNRNSGTKQKNYPSSVTWQCIDRLMNQGYTVDSAFQKMWECYGYSLSVTQIINRMIADSPNLR